LSEGFQQPLIRRKLVTKDINISVVRTNFVEVVIRTVPLIQNFVDQVLVNAKLKRDGTLVRFPSRIAFEFRGIQSMISGAVTLRTDPTDLSDSASCTANEEIP
jgi:hypothetical protein